MLGFSLSKFPWVVVEWMDCRAAGTWPGFWVRADTHESVEIDFWTSLPTSSELLAALTESTQVETFFEGAPIASSAGNLCIGLRAGADRSREVGHCEREVLRQDPEEDTRSQASIRRAMLEREPQSNIDRGG